MRVLVDIVDSITGLIRFGIGAVVFSGLLLTLLLTTAVLYYKPDPAEKAAQEARLLELEIKEKNLIEAEALRSQRDHALAKEGWGYDSSAAPTSSFDSSRSNRRQSSRSSDDWGD